MLGKLETIMDLALLDKTVVVTGASRGIGYACAQLFVLEGARVVLCGRNAGALAEAESRLNQLGRHPVAAVTADCTVRGQVAAVAQKAGALDVWVNNVGAPTSKSGPGYTDDEIAFGFDANVRPVLYGCEAAALSMPRGGVIVNISSMAARWPTAGDKSLYGPMKAAVEKLTVTLGAEYAARGIRVVGVAPGATETDMTRGALLSHDTGAFRGNVLNRYAQPMDIAAVVVFLASAPARHITCTTVDVSGGSGVVTNPEYGDPTRKDGSNGSVL